MKEPASQRPATEARLFDFANESAAAFEQADRCWACPGDFRLDIDARRFRLIDTEHEPAAGKRGIVREADSLCRQVFSDYADLLIGQRPARRIERR